MALSCFLALLLSSLAPPSNVAARDVPNDGGGSILVTWTASRDSGLLGYQVLRQAKGGTTWDTLNFAGREMIRGVSRQRLYCREG